MAFAEPTFVLTNLSRAINPLTGLPYLTDAQCALMVPGLDTQQFTDVPALWASEGRPMHVVFVPFAGLPALAGDRNAWICAFIDDTPLNVPAGTAGEHAYTGPPNEITFAPYVDGLLPTGTPVAFALTRLPLPAKFGGGYIVPNPFIATPRPGFLPPGPPIPSLSYEMSHEMCEAHLNPHINTHEETPAFEIWCYADQCLPGGESVAGTPLFMFAAFREICDPIGVNSYIQPGDPNNVNLSDFVSWDWFLHNYVPGDPDAMPVPPGLKFNHNNTLTKAYETAPFGFFSFWAHGTTAMGTILQPPLFRDPALGPNPGADCAPPPPAPCPDREARIILPRDFADHNGSLNWYVGGVSIADSPPGLFTDVAAKELSGLVGAPRYARKMPSHGMHLVDRLRVGKNTSKSRMFVR